MKKYIAVFLLASCSLWAKQDLDSMLESISKNSYEQESHELEKENVDLKKNQAKKRDFQDGLSVSAEYQANHRQQTDNNYTRKATMQLGPFFASAYHANGEQGDYTGVGVEKSIKDLWYSKYDTQLKQTELEEEADKWKYETTLQDKALALIKLYQNYQDSYSELGWNEEEYAKLVKEEKKLALSYQLGKSKRVDWDAVRVNRDNLALEISNLKDRLAAYKVQFEQEFRISLQDDTLEEIPILAFDFDKDLEKYKQASIEEKKQRIEMQEEAVKYLNYSEKMPDLKVRYEHLSPTKDRKSEDVVTLSLSKKLFADKYEVNSGQNRLEAMKLDLKQAEANLITEQRLKQSEYESYKTKYTAAQNTYELEKSKYEIKKMEYDLGKTDYLDVMDVFNKYLQAKVSVIKSRNALAGYLYEMRVRSK